MSQQGRNPHPARMRWDSFVAVFNFLGSVASVTGVSLLWLKGRGNIRPEDLLVFAIGVLFSLGLASAAVLILQHGHNRYVKGQSGHAAWTYWLLGVPVMVVVVFVVLGLVNKLMINLPINWFFE